MLAAGWRHAPAHAQGSPRLRARSCVRRRGSLRLGTSHPRLLPPSCRPGGPPLLPRSTTRILRAEALPFLDTQHLLLADCCRGPTLLFSLCKCFSLPTVHRLHGGCARARVAHLSLLFCVCMLLCFIAHHPVSSRPSPAPLILVESARMCCSAMPSLPSSQAAPTAADGDERQRVEARARQKLAAASASVDARHASPQQMAGCAPKSGCAARHSRRTWRARRAMRRAQLSETEAAASASRQ